VEFGEPGGRPFPADLDVVGAVERGLSETDADRRPYVDERGQPPPDRPQLSEREAAAAGPVSPEQTERLNEAIAGEVAFNLPHPAQVQRARERLASGRPTLDDVKILMRQAVGEARAFFRGEPGGLAAADLAGWCPMGRDLSTLSLSTLVEGSRVPIRVQRYSLSGLAARSSGEAHQFGAVEFDLPDGTQQRFIVDPTFSQFALDGGSVPFNRVRGRAGGAEMMARLMSDGFVPLNTATARAYLEALVPLGHQPIDPGRLLRGEGGLGAGGEDLSRISHLTFGPGAEPLRDQMRRIRYVEPAVEDLVGAAQALRNEGLPGLAHVVDELRARLHPYDIDNLPYLPDDSAPDSSQVPLIPSPRPFRRTPPEADDERVVTPRPTPLRIRARIDDIREAERMFREQMQEYFDGLPDISVRPRVISDSAVVQAEWENRYGGVGVAPPAWVDSDGSIVVDATRVDVYGGWPQRAED
jgi:hypothetical protein